MVRTPSERRFDRAVAHFNATRFHEAHEDWEDLWNEAEGAERLWLQGLIQYAAGLFHFERGFYDTGFAKLMQQAHEKTAGYRGPTWGLDVAAFAAESAPWVAHGARVAAGGDLRAGAPPHPPRIAYVAGVEPDPLPPEPEEDED